MPISSLEPLAADDVVAANGRSWHPHYHRGVHLVTQQQIDQLADQLDGDGTIRVGEISADLDPFDFARTGAALVDRAVAFSGPSGSRLVGMGTAWRASASGSTRFSDLKPHMAALAATPGTAGRNLKAFMGFSFGSEPGEVPIWDGYDAAELFVPRITIEGANGGSIIRVVIPAEETAEATLELLASVRRPEWLPVVDLGEHSAHAHPPVSEWAASVDKAVVEILAGRLDKVVLARSVVVGSAEPPAILRMFRELVRSYPQCYNFAWKSGDAVFMGASPELLAAVRGDHLTSNPLAGSAPRGEGSIEDDALGEELLASDKDRWEHALVVNDIRERLAPLTTGLEASAEPELKKMASVQHLSTLIDATLNDGAGLLDVIEAIHPTPAVCGVPTDTAVRLIDELETIDRGWYTGGVGWMDTEGDGAVALGLRCGLIRGTTTHLFAGAGIVEGSRPDAELRETRLKLEPLLKILTAT